MNSTTQRSSWPLILLSLFLGVVCCGCRIEFDGQSEILDDGSISRTSAFKAQETADKEEILSRYELPEGGAWTESIAPIFKFLKKEPIDQALSTYQVKRIFAPSEQPVTDFKRFTPKKDRFAKNQFQVKVEDWWLARRYSYEESYSDIIEPEKIKLVLDQILEKGMTTFQSELALRTKDQKFIDALSLEIKNKYGTLLKRYYDLVEEKGWNFEEVSKLSDEIEKEFTPEAVSKLMQEKMARYDKEENRKIIGEAFHACEPVLAEFFESNRALWTDDYAIFGAHGFAIFHYYDFKIKVLMPGNIIWSNAAVKTGSTLEWNFGSSELNQKLMARSLKIYWHRLLAVILLAISAGALLIFLILTALGKRKKA